MTNSYLAAFFRSNTDSGIDLYTSGDGVNFTKLNKTNIRVTPSTTTPATAEFLSGRDPSIFYYNGNGNKMWIIGTTTDRLTPPNFDFTCYTSPDLITWNRFECKLGSNPLFKTMFNGLSCDYIWAPSFFTVDDRLFVAISIRFHPDAPDVHKQTIPVLRQFHSECINLATMSFTFPRIFDQDNAHDFTCKIDGHIYQIDGIFFLVCSNAYYKRIEIWKSSSFDGSYSLIETIPFTSDVEAPTLIIEKFWNGTASTHLSRRFHIYGDFYNNGTYRKKESTNLTGPWTSERSLGVEAPIRHGDIINVSSNVSSLDKFAQDAVDHARATYGSNSNPALEIPFSRAPYFPTLNAGPSMTWWPIYGALYSTDGSATYSAPVDIRDLPADLPDGFFFHVCVYSAISNGQIIIRHSGSNMQIGGRDIILNGASGADGQVRTLKKIAGKWRILV